MKVIVTGASGVLGYAIYTAFKAAGNQVLGLANSRPTDELKKLDLLDRPAVDAEFSAFQPDWVIHCAAERRPDVAEKNPAGTTELNANLPGQLAEIAKTLKFKLIHISTDYVFDGSSPPYTPASTTNPVNLYGRTKRDGELAVLACNGADVVVLRVPVLYGPAPKNSDSAVNILLDIVQDQSGKTYQMDHYATRYPTNVLDVASFLVRLAASKKTILPILHFSAPEPFTKYEMCLIFAQILSVPHGHIIPDTEAPTGAAATARPRNTQLDTRETEALMEDVGGLGCVLFDEWWNIRLGGASGSVY